MMVGTGAGVAPFRAFWSDLEKRGSRSAPTTLFFGCRHPDRDWIYAEEMKAVSSDNLDTLAGGTLSELVLAFSRMGEGGEFDPSGNCGEYVQDQLRARSADVKNWLDQKGVVYICGSNPVCHAVLG